MSISKIIKAVTEARHGAPAPHVCVVGEGEPLSRVVGLLSAGAADERGGVYAALDALSPADFPREERLARRWDLVIIVAEGCPAAEAGPVVHAARRAGGKVIALAEAPDAEGWAREAGFFEDEIARGVGRSPAARPGLENRMIHALGDGAGSLARTLPSIRRTYCDHVILNNATQNGVIGVVVIIPGADMPAMTANQIRMILKIAHAYGEELGLDRALEILSIVGAGFILRTVAREALDLVPGFGWAVKGAVGFSGTVALGEAAVQYFEAGAPLRTSRIERLNRQLEKVRSRIPGPLQRLASG